jgi:hypothetical protein
MARLTFNRLVETICMKRCLNNGHTYAEIGRVAGKSASAVRRQLKKAGLIEFDRRHLSLNRRKC